MHLKKLQSLLDTDNLREKKVIRLSQVFIIKVCWKYETNIGEEIFQLFKIKKIVFFRGKKRTSFT